MFAHSIDLSRATIWPWSSNSGPPGGVAVVLPAVAAQAGAGLRGAGAIICMHFIVGRLGLVTPTVEILACRAGWAGDAASAQSRHCSPMWNRHGWGESHAHRLGWHRSPSEHVCRNRSKKLVRRSYTRASARYCRRPPRRAGESTRPEWRVSRPCLAVLDRQELSQELLPVGNRSQKGRPVSQRHS